MDNSTDRPLCIYHGGCPDGFTAAWIVDRHFPRGAELHPAQYGDDPPDVTGRDVFVVDFSYKRPVMEAIRDAANTLTVLDHHKTAAGDLAGLDEAEGCRVVFDMDRSGAMIAWDWLNLGEVAPTLVCYVQDRDLWTRALPGNDAVFAAITARPHTIEAWDELNRMGPEQLIAQGEAVAMYRRRLIEQAVANAYHDEIGGHLVLVANCVYAIGSEVAGELAVGYPFGAYYFDLPNGVRQWGLRSAEDGADVSAIAAQFGGGGHKHAAGFKTAA